MADPAIKTMPPLEKKRSMELAGKLDIASRIALKTREQRMFHSDHTRVAQKEHFKEMVNEVSQKEREKLPKDLKNIFKLLDEYNGINVTATSDVAKESKFGKLRLALRILFGRGKKRKAIRKEEDSLRDARTGIIDALKKYSKKPEYADICDKMNTYLQMINHTMGMLPDNEKYKTQEEKFKQKGWKMDGAKVLDTRGRKLTMTSEESGLAKIAQEKNADAKRYKDPLFAHEPCVEDIRQGGQGDCWFLAALANVVKDSSQAIRNMMLDNGDGSVTVRFFEDTGGEKMQPYYVTVSKHVRVQYATDCFWVQIMEKAYSAFLQAHAKTDKKTGKKILERKGNKKALCSDKVIDYGFIDGGNSHIAIANLLGIKGRKESIIKTEKKETTYFNTIEMFVDKMKEFNPEANEKAKIDKKIDGKNTLISALQLQIIKDVYNEDDYTEFLKKREKSYNLDIVDDFENFLERLKKEKDSETAMIEGAKQYLTMPEIAESNKEVIRKRMNDLELLKRIIEDFEKGMNSNEKLMELKGEVSALNEKRDKLRGYLTYPPQMNDKVAKFLENKDNGNEIIEKMSDLVRRVLNQHNVVVGQNSLNLDEFKEYAAFASKNKEGYEEPIVEFDKISPEIYEKYLDILEKRIKGESVASDPADTVLLYTEQQCETIAGQFNLPLDELTDLIKEWTLGIVKTMRKNISILPSTDNVENIDAFSGKYDEAENEQWSYMMDNWKKGAVFNAGTSGNSDRDSDRGIVEGHAYTITNLEEIGKCRFVHLRNPHAVTTAEYKLDEKTNKFSYDKNEEDTNGVFVLEFSDFCKKYDALYTNV